MKANEALEIVWHELRENEVPFSDAIKLAMETLENEYGESRADLAKPSEWISGLKDHEIQELVNAIRDNLLCLDGLVNMGPLREIISGATNKYLEGKNLRIDRPSPPTRETK